MGPAVMLRARWQVLDILGRIIMITILKTDISRQKAIWAYSNVSFNPEKRADQEQEYYFEHVTNFYNSLLKGATEAEKQLIDIEVERYRLNYISKTNDILSAKTRCTSSAITGGSGFNVRRAEKANNSEHNKTEAFYEWREKAEKSIRKKLEILKVQEAGGAVEVLKQKIKKAEETQEVMKSCNKIIKKKIEKAEKLELLKKVVAGDIAAALLEKPDCFGIYGFASYQLTNNNARIKNMKLRLLELERRENTETSKTKFAGGFIVDNLEADRIQILFDEKPGPDMLGKLKGRGFRWSPRYKAWQRMRTNNTRYTIKHFLGLQIN